MLSDEICSQAVKCRTQYWKIEEKFPVFPESVKRSVAFLQTLQRFFIVDCVYFYINLVGISQCILFIVSVISRDQKDNGFAQV